MDTPFPKQPENAIAYIRDIPRERLPDELRARLGTADTIYGIHNAAGECLALTADRTLAFVLARQNDLAPVSVH